MKNSPLLLSIMLALLLLTSTAQSQTTSVAASDTFVLKLGRLWNFISLPLKMPPQVVSSLFPFGTSDAYGYLNGYMVLRTVRHGEGFWIKSVGYDSVVLIGERVTTDTISVYDGWSILGSISVPVDVTHLESIPPGIILTVIVLNPRWPYGMGTKFLMPGWACWIKTSGAGKIILK